MLKELTLFNLALLGSINAVTFQYSIDLNGMNYSNKAEIQNSEKLPAGYEFKFTSQDDQKSLIAKIEQLNETDLNIIISITNEKGKMICQPMFRGKLNQELGVQLKNDEDEMKLNILVS